MVDIEPLTDWTDVDRAIEQLPTYDWLGFTSANGVHAFLQRVIAIGRDMRALGSVQIAAIGPRTADVLSTYHLRADVVPDVYRSEELAAALTPHVRDKRVLLARANRGRDVLPTQLAQVAPCGSGHGV